MAPKTKDAPPAEAAVEPVVEVPAPEEEVPLAPEVRSKRRAFLTSPAEDQGTIWQRETDPALKAWMEGELRALPELQRNALPYHVRATLGLLKR